MAFDRFCMIVSFKIPKAVELSFVNDAVGCLCPNSIKITPSGAQLWAF
jgi:hypothetical protein